MSKNDIVRTAAIGLTLSIARLIILTARFQASVVLMVSMASSARRRVVREISVLNKGDRGTPALPRSTLVGSESWTAAVREELALAVEAVIVKERVAGSVECLASPSALLKMMSSSTCRTLSQMRK